MKVVLGWIINLLAVAVAASVGAELRGRIRTRYQEIVVLSCGLVTGVIGLWGACHSLLLFTATDKKGIEIAGSILIVVALVAGTGLGHVLEMEQLMDKLAGCFSRFSPGKSKQAVAAGSTGRAGKGASSYAPRSATSAGGKGTRRRFRELPVYNLPSARSGHRFADGFAIATLLLCVNPFMLSAAARAGATGAMSALYYMAIVNFVLSGALAFVYGWGVAFAAVPFGLVQGVMMGMGKLQSKLAAHYTETVADYTAQVDNFSGSKADKAVLQATLDNEELKRKFWSSTIETGSTVETSSTIETILSQMCVIGGIILIALALNLACGKKFKVAHMLPALLIPFLYYGLVLLAKLA